MKTIERGTTKTIERGTRKTIERNCEDDRERNCEDDREELREFVEILIYFVTKNFLMSDEFECF